MFWRKEKNLTFEWNYYFRVYLFFEQAKLLTKKTDILPEYIESKLLLEYSEIQIYITNKIK